MMCASSPGFDRLRVFRLDDVEYTAIVSGEIERNFRTRLVGSLRNSLIDSATGNVHQVAQQLASIGSTSLRRILEAPETVFRLQSCISARELVTWLEAAIACEALLQEKCSFPPGRWTALGDAGCDAHGTQWRARELDGAIVWDCWSPGAQRPFQKSALRERQVRPTPLANGTEEIEARIKESFQILHETCVAAYALIIGTTQTIVGISDMESPQFFTSASSRNLVGRITLINPHLPEADVAGLMAALVHESTHSFLYKVEHQAPLCKMEREALDVRIASPWSGALLRLPTVLHAAYVYFSLMHVFVRHEALGRAMSEPAWRIRKRAIEGFVRKDLISHFVPHRSMIADWVWTDLCRMVEEAVASS